jgi:AcrR family transcriptional regulator
MPRQARSETTRRRILDAAVELFNEDGYAATGLGDIIERAALSKGALYYHFDSKESLAAAIMAEAAGTVYAAVRAIVETASPAFESMIHSSFIVAEIVAADPLVRTGSHLARSLGGFHTAVAESYLGILAVLRTQTARAAADGDLRPELDIEAVADTLLSAYLGAEVLAIPSQDNAGMVRRLTNIWNILLPALATADALPFLQEFVSREALRHAAPTMSID